MTALHSAPAGRAPSSPAPGAAAPGPAHAAWDPAEDLPGRVWPRTARRGTDGALELGGVDVRALAAEHGTPLLVLDTSDLRERCRVWREAVGDGDVYYASKAFLTVGVARLLHAEGLRLDVCTGGEMACAVRAGVPGEDLLFHGNNKSVPELERAVAAGVGRVVLDSREELHRLAGIAQRAGVRQRVLVRVTPGVEAHVHEFVATGVEDQKFGFSLASGAAEAVLHEVLATPSLELVGLHCHIGSSVTDTRGFALATERMVSLLARLAGRTGVELPELDLGGGLGIAYTPDEVVLGVAEFVGDLRRLVGDACEGAGLRVPRLAVEPGRALSGPTTVTLYEVGTVKELPGLRTYVSVDGGMSDNIRTSLYGARYSALLASRASAAARRAVTLVGKHCESGDVVAPDVPLPADLAPGDLVAVPASGAYHHSMASTYNMVGRPPVVAVEGGDVRVLVRRETEDDLFARDLG